MSCSIPHQEIFSAIDKLFDAEQELIEAKRDLAKGLFAWLESQQASAQCEASGREMETRPAPIRDGLMTLQEAANFLHVSEQTVHAWRKRGIIEGLQFGEEWRFQRDELIKAGRKTQASKKPLRMVS